MQALPFAWPQRHLVDHEERETMGRSSDLRVPSLSQDHGEFSRGGLIDARE